MSDKNTINSKRSKSKSSRQVPESLKGSFNKAMHKADIETPGGPALPLFPATVPGTDRVMGESQIPDFPNSITRDAPKWVSTRLLDDNTEDRNKVITKQTDVSRPKGGRRMKRKTKKMRTKRRKLRNSKQKTLKSR
jgi:hypothetical protein